eukprot:TRINITY_DN32853_c0_g1_i1.p1 TRINITY_DN32853_c0_g1~~TRINITY_DN32853_c0_g1_i1.p1  ORF type:complete len:375 (+),score=77.05 TRINITY_DN32853_c0_g1_i1:89-1126(+)
MAAEKLRVFMYEPSSRPALGHLRRLKLLADYIGASYEACIALATALPVRLPEGMQLVKLPGKPDPSAVYAAIEDFDPHLVIVDFKPKGFRGELEDWLKRGKRCVRIHTQRDVIEEPSALSRLWGSESTQWGVSDGMQAVSDYYAEVWAVGNDSDVSPFEGLPGCEDVQLVRLGYFSEATRCSPNPVLPFPPEVPFVVVAGGGGSTAADMYSVVIAAHRQRAMQGCTALPRCAIVCGPFLPAADFAAISAAGAALSGRVVVLREADVACLLRGPPVAGSEPATGEREAPSSDAYRAAREGAAVRSEVPRLQCHALRQRGYGRGDGRGAAAAPRHPAARAAVFSGHR